MPYRFYDVDRPAANLVVRLSPRYRFTHAPMIGMDSTDDSIRSKTSTEDDVQSISRSSRGISEDHGQALPGHEDAAGMERHRNMMLASLLEDYYRSRALEFLSSTNPGQLYTRQSQEVEALASQLFGQARQVLSSNGLLSPRATSDASRGIRQQYLSGLDSLVTGTQTVNILDSMQDLVAQASQLNIAAPPINDLQLTLRHPPPPPYRSHYKSSFREDRLLGRGGFGKVYQCYNVLDQKTYAVKKIVLPRKLVKSFSNGRHDDLADVLREVKASKLYLALFPISQWAPLGVKFSSWNDEHAGTEVFSLMISISFTE